MSKRHTLKDPTSKNSHFHCKNLFADFDWWVDVVFLPLLNNPPKEDCILLNEQKWPCRWIDTICQESDPDCFTKLKYYPEKDFELGL